MILIYTYFGFVGACIASFLGVVIDRLPKKLPFVAGRSHCDVCKRDLSIIELIPILSFLIQGGKCRKCKSRLSWRYLIIEVIGATCFILCFHQYGFSIQYLFSIVYVCLLILIGYIDFDTMIINDRFNLMIAILGIISILLGYHSLTESIIAALIFAIPLSILSLGFNAMGFGDVKLVVASAFLLGLKPLIVAFIIAVILGGLHGIYLMSRKNVSRTEAIPFAPYLCIGLFIASLYGIQIATWYLSLIIG